MFESIAEYIPEIEARLLKGHRPSRIASDLGLPKTIVYDTPLPKSPIGYSPFINI